MSYQEKRSIVNLVSSIFITILYSSYMVQRYPETGPYSVEVFRFWGTFFLILIPVSIVARILMHIAFAIINTVTTHEEESDMMDERDKLFELKATRNSLYVFSAGVILAVAALVVDMPPSAMFVVLICAGLVSDMVSEISQFYFYRRGY